MQFQKNTVKLLWIAGIAIWAAALARGFWVHGQAQSYAQASSASYSLIAIALAGAFWSVAASLWVKKLEKERIQS